MGSPAKSKLIFATVLCTLFMLVEVCGGLLAHSLAVLTDAGHLLADIAGFAVSLFSLSLAEQVATPDMSFGFKRAEIIGALLSVSLIWFVTAILLVEAYGRAAQILTHDKTYVPVHGGMMMATAGFGLVANLVMLRVLGADHGHSHGDGAEHGSDEHSPKLDEERGPVFGHDHSHGSTLLDEERGLVNHGHSHHHASLSDIDDFHSAASSAEEEPTLNGLQVSSDNINVQAAYVHAMGDLAQSLSVLLAALAIWLLPDVWFVQLADPLCTLIFSLFVVYTTVSITKTSLRVLMQAVPIGFDPTHIKAALSRVPGVVSVHEVHFWSITLNDNFFSCHVVAGPGAHDVLPRVRHVLTSQFGIRHASIQVEDEGHACLDAAPCSGRYGAL